MPGPADGEARKRQVSQTFDSIAPRYDTLQFARRCADRLVELARLPAGGRVLDVGTGTGAVAVAAARAVGPSGRVVGIDLSPRMLDQARQKVSGAGLTQVELRQGDAQSLDLPDESFDVVLCASSLFFVPDMLTAVREWRRVLVPGGRAGFSSFAPGFLQPLRELWTSFLERRGIPPPAPPVPRLGDTETCRMLLESAGLEEVELFAEQLGYHVPGGAERWNDITAGVEGAPLAKLTAEERDRIRAEHIAELEALKTKRGIWVDVPALLAFGRREPSRPPRA